MLVKINERHCPYCAAPAASMGLLTGVDGSIRVHSNGQRWEWIQFSCGKRIERCPNFECIDHKGECCNDEAVKARKAARRRLLQDLVAIIRSDKDVDEYTRAELVNALSWRL